MVVGGLPVVIGGVQMPHRETWKVVRRAWGVTSVYQRVVKCCTDCRTLRFGMVPRTHHSLPGAFI